MSDDDLLVFADEIESEPVRPPRTWKVAVIDDDPAVHEGTRFALWDYSLAGQGLEILSARSAAEGRALLRAHPDLAVILLDVVMETETAGLELVEFIRGELGNELVRIILRTGQPGQAPERGVIVGYDINDYKAKTELTADKLFTALTSAIRSHQQLLRMEETRRGLEIIIDAATALFDTRSMRRFAEGVLTQVASLLEVDCAGMLVVRDGSEARGVGELAVIAGSGIYSGLASAGDVLDGETRAEIDAAFADRRHCFFDRRSVFLLYIRTAGGREIAVVLDVAPPALRHRSGAGRGLLRQAVGRLRERPPARATPGVQRRSRTPRRGPHPRAERGRSPSLRTARDAAPRQRVQGGTARHGRPRPEESDRRHPRPLRDHRGTARTAGGRRRPAEGRGREDPRAGVGDEPHDRDLVGRRRPTRWRSPYARCASTSPISPTTWSITCVRWRPASSRPSNGAADVVIPLLGDPDRLRDALGERRLQRGEVRAPVGGKVEIAVRAVADRAVVTVADQGPGLFRRTSAGSSAASNAFRPSRPAGRDRSVSGLSIAHEIVRLHGGHIGAINAENGPGAVFEIVLPTLEDIDDDRREGTP